MTYTFQNYLLHKKIVVTVTELKTKIVPSLRKKVTFSKNFWLMHSLYSKFHDKKKLEDKNVSEKVKIPWENVLFFNYHSVFKKFSNKHYF